MTYRLWNDGDETVAELDYDVVVTEEGRSVPWGKGAGRVPVYGGIEPGETVEFSFPVEGLPAAARGRDLRWEFSRLRARGLDGRRLGAAEPEEPSASDQLPSDPHAPDEADPVSRVADASAVGIAVAACWDPAALPSDAQRIPVTLGFDLDENGHLESDIRLLSGSLGEDPVFDQAVQAAIKAVEACGESGYPPPPQGDAAWDWVVLTFDPVHGEIR